MEEFKKLCYSLDIKRDHSGENLLEVERRVMETRSTIKAMLSNEELCDVVFVCADGARVCAIRKLLCSGCDVLKTMLMNGMKESRLRDVQLPEVSSTALRIILDYLYFGTFDLHKERCCSRKWNDGLLTIKAANFLLLEKLESLVWKVLVDDVDQSIRGGHNDFSNPLIRLSVVSDLISADSKFPDCMTKRLNVISSALLHFVRTRWLTESELRHMSKEALLLWLREVGDVLVVDELRLDVYVRLRQVLVWCLCQTHKFAESLVDSYFPSGNEAWCLIQNHTPDKSKRRRRPRQPYVIFPSEKKCQVETLREACLAVKFEESFLHLLDIHLLHPVVLTKIVEPVQIFSSLDLLTDMKNNALSGRQKSVGAAG